MSLLTRKKMSFATQTFDSKTNRIIDENGRLIVEKSLITKAEVNQYYGKEIPNYQKYGLDANTKYNVLRPLDELEKCIEKFNMLPLLSKHVMDYSHVPQKDSWTGCMSKPFISDKCVYGSLSVWDNTEIHKIETEEKRDLSLGYDAIYVKESGEFEGVPYDLVMRNIIPNHLALVKEGRVKGAEVFDENKIKGDGKMNKLMGLFKTITGFFDENPEELKKVDEIKDEEGQLAKLKEILDSKFGVEKSQEIMDVITSLKKDEAPKVEPKVEPEVEPKVEPKEEPKLEEKKDGCTMDELKAAVEKAKAEAIAETKKAYAEIEKAKEDTKSVIGNVGVLDSASEYYKLGCQAVGIDIKGMEDSKFKDVFMGAKVVMDNQKKTNSVVLDEKVVESSQKKLDVILSKLPERK